MFSPLLLLIQGCSNSAHSTKDPSNAQQVSISTNQAPLQNITAESIEADSLANQNNFSDEKQAWFNSENWDYYGNGMANNVGWNDTTNQGDLNLVARYSNDPTNCHDEFTITGPFYSNRISGIFTVNGQDVHFKYMHKLNEHSQMYRPTNPKGLEFLLGEFTKQQPVTIQSDIGTVATFPSKGFNDAKQAIHTECLAKLQRERNAL
ncbi:hypothetical protein VEZ01S_23_00070 [Vibrio ezurae NBRC 102218]|uniref:Uncharacterized protein n=2 Tax=Vibrio ezurae TaxID=252583 RepID=U3B265_9VIBR|nr:hypothetical protein VEZ01S_23_00070 [Vibrio ezurae NBRC 102218]